MADDLIKDLQAAYPPSTSPSTAQSASPGSSGGAAGAGGDYKAQFVQMMAPVAERLGAKNNIPPDALIAQWALETGWGRSVIPGTNNYGNIKDFSGSGVSAKDNATGSVDKYRQYATLADFESGFDKLLQSPRYRPALGTGSDALLYGQGLARGGYAEDQQYPEKIAAMARQVRSMRGMAPAQQGGSIYPPRSAYVGNSDKVLSDARRQEKISQEGLGDAFARGFGEATDQIPELAAGSAAFLGDVLGVDTLREAGLAYVTKHRAESAEENEGRAYPSFSDSVANGDLGRWAAYALGYGVNQIGQAVATGGLGAAVAKAGLSGLLKGTAQRAMSEALARGATQEVAAKAATEAAELAAKKYGAALAMSGYTYGQEVGSIYPDAIEQSKKTGVPADLAKVAAAAGIAAALEVAPEIGIAGKLIDGAGKGSRSMLGRAAVTIPKQIGLQGGTEYAQAGVEQWGANKPLDTPEAQRERIDSAAMGAIMGGPAGAIEAAPAPRPVASMADQAGAGAVGGVAQGAQVPPGHSPQPILQPHSPLSNAASIGQAAMGGQGAQPAAQGAPQDPFADRVAAMGSFVEDRSFIQALRGAQGYGPESVAEALSAYAKAKNPNLNPLIRERALIDLEQFVQGFSGRPNFTFGSSQSRQPGTQVSPVHETPVGRPTPRAAPDDGMTLDGEVINRPRPAGQLPGAPIHGLPSEQDIAARRQAEADYDQGFQDLVKADHLGAADRDLMEVQQAQREAKAQNEAAEARLAEIQQAIEGRRQEEAAQRRRAVLDEVLADHNTRNPAARFAAELKRQGFRDSQVSADELARIQRFEDIKAAQVEQPDHIHSSPNEMDVYEPPRALRQPSQARPAPASPQEGGPTKKAPARALAPKEIRDYIVAGATLSGNLLTLPDGTVITLRGPQLAAAREAVRALQVQAGPEDATGTDSGARNEAPPTGAGSNGAEGLAGVAQDGSDEAGGARTTQGSDAPFAGTGVDPAQTQEATPAQPTKPQSIRAVLLKQIPSMTDEEIQRAIEYYGPDHKRTAKLKKEAARRLDPKENNQAFRDFLLHPEAILSEISSRGALASLVKEAGLKKRDAFDRLPLKDQAKAYAKFVESGAGPVKVPGDYNTHVSELELAADRRRTMSESERIEEIRGVAGLPSYTQALERALATLGVHVSAEGDATATEDQWGEIHRLAISLMDTPISELDKAAHEAATSPLNDTPEPTDAQKAAGNYKVGHVRVQGMDISIENPKGSVRSGTSPDGAQWSNPMHAHYGYFTGTKAADGDHLDVFLADGAEDAPMVWVIDQKNPDGSFDEHKVVMGPRTEEAARDAYLANYDPGWDGIGAITSMPVDAFKAWVFDGKKKRKPLAYVESTAESRFADRIARYGDTLIHMAIDAGWEERGGTLLRDTQGNPVGRTKWIPRAEWFLAGMEADPATLERSIKKALQGEFVRAKQRRTIEGMVEWLEHHGAPEDGHTDEADLSYYDFDPIGYSSVEQQVADAYDALEDLINSSVALSTADAMAMMGFTQEEINEIESEKNPAGGEGEAVGADHGAAQAADQPDSSGQGIRGAEGGLSSYSEQDLAAIEAEAKRREQAAKDADRKAAADDEVGSFVLTGSDRSADALEARGQGGLFDLGEDQGQDSGNPLHRKMQQVVSEERMPSNNIALRKLVEDLDGERATPARMKEAQEALEAAIVGQARKIVANAQESGTKSTFDALLSLYESQPLLNARTSTSISNQAYSTPAPLAYLASQLAGIGSHSIVYEPTAGNGMLLIGASPQNAFANELNPARADALKTQGFHVSEEDASQFSPGVSADAVIANPPFGSIKDDAGAPIKVKVDGYRIGQIDHLIAARALSAMKDGGRAVLILGANKVQGGISNDDLVFFNWLYSHYDVRGHFEVDGKLYVRQGASWPVRVISIAGRKVSNSVAPARGSIQRAGSWEEVYERYENSLDSIRGSERVATGGAGSPSVFEAGKPVAARGPAGPKNPADGERQPAGGTAGDGDVQGVGAGPVGNRGKQQPERVGDSVVEQRPAAKPSIPDRLESSRGVAGKPAGNLAVGDPGNGGVADNAFQSPYVSRSDRKDEGVLIPKNMAFPTQAALDRLEDAVGDIDAYAARQLGYSSVSDLHGALMGLQIDSVASAIYQISEKGKGVIIADQTGIGKGRQAASMIRWAIANGKTPVFVTVKPSLFTDMFGDLADIGSNDVRPFIMNIDEHIKGKNGEKLFSNTKATHKTTIREIAATGRLPDGRNALFMTYSQINVQNVQRSAVEALAPNAVFILDESHNAGGDSSTGNFVRDVLGSSPGVVYLSATFAKRPDNMPVYFRTDIGQAVADNQTLMSAMSSGGLPLQTVVSNNLVKSGQMFRRERSYEGVSIESRTDSAHRDQHAKLSDAATTALRAIVRADSLFHTIYFKERQKEAEKAGGRALDIAGNQASSSVNHTEFSSVVHNFVRQMLLGLKAQSAADLAIESLKSGEKPLIAVENTVGSFLAEYAEANGVAVGGDLGSFDYRSVLSRALERTRYVVIQHTNGDKVREFVPLGELDGVTRKAYDDAQALINSLDVDIPVSPIDWMRNEIEKAGYSVAEITGRSLAVDYSDGFPKLSLIDAQEQRDKVETTRRFNDGRLDAVILNVAGSTGISLHASERFADQRQRHMIVAQPAQDINIFMQMLGRIHRTGQVRLPKYTILGVDLPAEKRPMALTADKMKSLNANTSSNTESATSVQAVSLLNKYGDNVVAQYLDSNLELSRALGILSPVDSDGNASEEDLARKATGRLALMPVHVQKSFYDEVEDQYRALINYLNETNQNELEPRTFDFDAKEVAQQVMYEGENPESPFGEDAIYGEYSIKAQGKAMKPEEIKAAIEENLDGKTWEQHRDALISKLDASLNEYTSRLQNEADLESSKKQAVNGRYFIHTHAIGSMFRVEVNDETYSAIITNIRSTHKSSGNPYALSKIQVTVALNGSLRSITVPATQFSKIQVSMMHRDEGIDRVFAARGVENEREKAKIITGNLLAAYGEIADSGVRATIISFTKSDGSTEQGILLPKSFVLAKDTRQDYRLKTGEDAYRFLMHSANPDVGRFGISTRDGDVRVTPSGDGVKIRVPKSKARGGKFFLDGALIRAAGDEFASSGNYMEVTVPGERAAGALDALINKQALYTLPSMAEEARRMSSSQDTPGTLRNTPDYDPYEAVSRKDAEDFIRNFVAQYPGAPSITLVDSFIQLPQELQDDALAQGSGPTRAKGALKNGKAYVVLNTHTSMRDLEETVFHEVLGHAGIRKMLGQEFTQALNRMFIGLGGFSGLRKIMERRGMAEQFDSYRQGLEQAKEAGPDVWTDALVSSILTEEVMAHIAEQGPTSLRDRFMALVGAVRDWLRRHGFPLLSSMGESDLLHLLNKAQQGMRDAAPGPARTGTPDGPRILVDSHGKPVAKEGSPDYGMIKLISGHLGLRETQPTVFRSDVAGPGPVRSRVADLIDRFGGDSAKTFNWWQRTVGSQYGKARSDKDFGRVYWGAHAFLDGVADFAKTASSLAPSILPSMDTLRDTMKGMNIRAQWSDSKDYQAIAPAIFEGTTANGATGQVWSDDQLRARFGLNDRQIGMYHEFREAVNHSLSTLAASEMARMARASKMEVADRDMGADEALSFYADQIQGKLDDLAEAHQGMMLRHQLEMEDMRRLLDSIPNEESRLKSMDAMLARHEEEAQQLEGAIDPLRKLRTSFAEVAGQVRRLQDEGYAPLARFGQYTVDVVRIGEDGEPVIEEETGEPDRPFFGMFETEGEAREAARIMAEEYPGYTVTRGILSADSSKLYQGMTPETAEMFARMLGVSVDDAFQAYLRQAIANGSAMKRLIKRKGVAGFSNDVPRVLASFLTSNARMASANWYFGEMAKAIEAIPQHKGDVRDEAIRLAQYVQNPQEEASGLRGFLFFNFIGGSIASALTNLTQTFSTTLPYLHQFAPGADVAKALNKAMKTSGKIMAKGIDSVSDPALRAALHRASEEGATDPQEIHLLMAESGGNGASIGLASLAGMVNKEWATPAARVTRSLVQAWGSLFGAAEKFNRHVAFIAAWEAAPQGVDRYEFAKNAITETQFDYTKASRPNWARGAIGATLFTFKTFTVNYLEFLSRLPARERALALAVLFLMAGLSGMPGADDLDDLLDTLGQKLGYNWNSKAAKHAWMVKTLTTGGANFVEHGISSLLPFDVSARLGVSNIIPGSGVLMKSNDKPARDVQEFFGPIGSVMASGKDVFDSLGGGKGAAQIMRPLAPKSVGDLYQAADMLQTGQYRDRYGRKVVDVSAVDAVLKGIGFQPNSVAEPRRVQQMLAQSASMYQAVRKDVHALMASGLYEGDQDKIQAARDMVRTWNDKNPDSRIQINPSSVASRVRAMRETSGERLVKASPKDMRGALAAEMAATH